MSQARGCRAANYLEGGSIWGGRAFVACGDVGRAVTLLGFVRVKSLQ